MSNIDIWFRSEVSLWRSGAALVWTLVLTIPAVCVCASLGNISLWSPFRWIYGSLVLVCSLSTWLYILLIMLAVIIFAVQNSRQFTVVPTIHSTRLEKLVSLVRLRSMYRLCWTSVLCTLMAWVYTRLVRGRYSRLTKECQPPSEGVCLNESQLFLVVFGLFLGVCQHFWVSLSGGHQLVFPIVQQSKLFQLKISGFQLIVQSAWSSLYWLKYLCLLYFLVLGNILQKFFNEKFGLPIGSDDTRVNSVSGMLDLGLLWHAFVCGTMIQGLMALSSQLFKLYHTEWYKFPVEPPGEPYQKLCLANALSCHTNPTLQYLGHLDLLMLSRYSTSRRQQVFALTKLGGHPQNWTSVSDECLALLQGFMDEIKGYNVKVMANGSIKHLASENALMTSNSGSSASGPHQRVQRVENLSATSSQPKRPTALQMIVDDLKKRKLVSYLVTEEADVSSHKLFAKSQLYMWAVESLSYLVVASYSEDKYGVVQKTLPNIITTLLDLQEQVEKHLRLLSSIGRRPETDADSDAALRNSLKATLKTSIYRIVTTFDTNIRSVPVPGDYMRRLNQFLDYKE